MTDDRKTEKSQDLVRGWLRHQVDVEPNDRIFVNRNLRMSSIEAVGFDMDHTLATYEPEPFEGLAFRKAQEKLVAKWKYPRDILDFGYDHDFVIRGLVVDKRRGNILKMDEHRYVTTAFHGTQPLSAEVRKQIYANRRIRLSGSNYSVIDTLFSLPEIHLYAKMVDFIDDHEKGRKDFRRLYEHTRDCVDEAHADGSIKSDITGEPRRYLHMDPELPQTLQRLRAHGKRLFLLTNSEPSYTDIIMSVMLSDAGPENLHWTDYFDAVVLQARKPSFFVRRESFQPIPEDCCQIPERNQHKVVVGGSVQQLERLLGVRGDRVLYFGDHTYGDMLKSKHSSGWRTAMIIQDLEQDLETMHQTSPSRRRQVLLERQRDRLVGWRDFLERSQEGELGRKLLEALLGKFTESGEQSPRSIAENVETLDEGIRSLDDEIGELELSRQQAFNRHWGAIFKAGRENSLFGAQVRSFACIYTTRVSNFLNYPVDKYFEAPHEFMPHEI
jgi:HAD superfamily 5'-nucleotidase-like hydrolase